VIRRHPNNFQYSDNMSYYGPAPTPHPNVVNHLIKKCRYCNKNINVLTEVFYTFGKEDKPNRKTRVWFVCPCCLEEVAGRELL
jgi:hypothetical protein